MPPSVNAGRTIAGSGNSTSDVRAMIDRDDPDKVLETIFKTGPATKKE